MVENRKKDSDQSKETVESTPTRSAEAQKEAAQGLEGLVDQQKKNMAYQKSDDRPAGFASKKFGKPTFSDDGSSDGKKLKPNKSTDRISHGEIESNTKAVPERMEASAQAISTAMAKWPADSVGVLEQLRNNTKTEDERQALRAAYKKQNNGESLDDALMKLSAADFECGKKYLNKGSIDDGDRVHAALTERSQWVAGRKNPQIERDIRDNLASKSPDEIRKMDQEYTNKDASGRTLSQSIAEDPNLSQDTKDACAIYLKGSRDADGSRPYEDVRKLADIAIKNRDESGMREAFRGSSDQVRKRFADDGGLDRINQKAEQEGQPDWGFHAQEIATRGELSVATQVRDNTGARVNNDKAIEANLTLLTPQERENFKRGREGKLDPNSQEYKDFDKLNKSVNGTSASEVYRETYRDHVAHPGGSLISHKLAPHAGAIYNDSTDKIVADIDKGLSREDFDLYKNSPEHRQEVKNYLQNTMKLDEKSVKAITDKLDGKTSARDFDEAQSIAAKEHSKPHRTLNDFVRENTVDDTLIKNGSNVWDKKQEFLKQVIDAPPAEREALRNNGELLSKVMSSLDKDQQQAMENLLKETPDGQPNNADIVRAHAVGLGVSKEEVLHRVAALTPEQKEQMKADYAKTYRRDAVYDVTGDMTGIERDRAVANFRSPPRDADEAMADARQDFVQTRGGGSGSVDLWDGTGRDYEKVYNRALEQKARGNMTLEDTKTANAQLDDHRQRHVQSKKEMADTGFTVGTTAATTLATLASAPVSVPAIIAGGLARDAIKQGVVGADGDTSVSGHLYNVAGGAAEVAVMKLGTGKGAAGAAAAGAAESVAKTTVTQSVKQFAKESAQSAVIAAGSTIPTSVIDGVHDADPNKSTKQNVQDGADRAVANMKTAAVTGVGFHAVARGVQAVGGAGADLHKSGSPAREVHVPGEQPPASRAQRMSPEELAKVKAYHHEAQQGMGERSQQKASVSEQTVKPAIVKPAQERVNSAIAQEQPVKPAIAQEQSGQPAVAQERVKPDLAQERPVLPAIARERPANILDRQVLENGQAKGVRLEKIKIGDPQNPNKPPEHILNYLVDGNEVATLKRHKTGWYQVEGLKEGPVGGNKVHVYGSPDGSTRDLAQVQKVILQGIHDDPELRKLTSQCKMHNPEIGHTGNDPLREFGTHGQESKAITFYAANPEDANLIAKKVDTLLAKHPELKLNKPHTGGSIDTIVGPSNRVGIVRDTWKAAPNSTVEAPRALVDPAVSARILDDPYFGKHFREGNQLNPEGLRRLENAMGLKKEILAYDKKGNLSMSIAQDADDMQKLAQGKHVDPSAPLYVTESGGEKCPRGQSRLVTMDTARLNDPNFLPEYRTGNRLRPDILLAVEEQNGLQKGSMSYDERGNLTIAGSRPVGNGVVEVPGIEKSSGLSDRWAMYKLYQRYRIDPSAVGS